MEKFSKKLNGLSNRVYKIKIEDLATIDEEFNEQYTKANESLKIKWKPEDKLEYLFPSDTFPEVDLISILNPYDLHEAKVNSQ